MPATGERASDSSVRARLYFPPRAEITERDLMSRGWCFYFHAQKRSSPELHVCESAPRNCERESFNLAVGLLPVAPPFLCSASGILIRFVPWTLGAVCPRARCGRR
jgi:hypothetical protein